jgi:hypothetical protein
MSMRVLAKVHAHPWAYCLGVLPVSPRHKPQDLLPVSTEPRALRNDQVTVHRKRVARPWRTGEKGD